MYDMGRAMRHRLSGTFSEEQRKQTLEQISQQRWSELDGGERRMVPGTPYELSPESTAVDREFYDYYRTPRGRRYPRSTTEFSFTPGDAAMNSYYPFAQIEAISPRPLLFIAGGEGALAVLQRRRLQSRGGTERACSHPQSGTCRPLRPSRHDPLRRA